MESPPCSEQILRFCIACDKFLPSNLFQADGKRKFTCIPHIRIRRLHNVLGTQDKRAFNSLRCRAREDMLTFGHKRMTISRKQVVAMLSDEQMANFGSYSLIPLRSEHPLTVDNVVVVTTIQRRYIMGKYRISRDMEGYKRDLKLMLESET